MEIYSQKRVLIACKKDSRPNYVNALSEYGMICDEKLQIQDTSGYDGLLLPGGGDIEPALFSEENKGSVNIDLELDLMQFDLLSQFYAARKPILGICRGMQVINVFFGGTLCQHLKNAEMHTALLNGDNVHEVNCDPNSYLYPLYGNTFRVNSAHHQGLKDIGKGLISQASCKNVVEAIRHESAPVYGVQWHPERMCLQYGSAKYNDGGLLLGFFYRHLQKT